MSAEIETVIETETPVTFDDLVKEIAALRQTQEQIVELISAIKDQVEPALEGIRNSPIGKMLGV